MIPAKSPTKLSKFLSLVLRHRPELIHLELDTHGWTNVSDLIKKMNNYGKHIDLATLKLVVENCNKQRFAFSPEGDKIRANQGHSIKVDLGYTPQIPPAILYHGTAKKYVDSIYSKGLNKRKRHHVHLSSDIATASKVGQRHGTLVIFKVLAIAMQEDGFDFFVADNGVWLTDHVPSQYLIKLDE